jgi:hypothetical protein
MASYEVNYSGWFYIPHADSADEARELFLEVMAEDHPEIDVDRVNSISNIDIEVK